MAYLPKYEIHFHSDLLYVFVYVAFTYEHSHPFPYSLEPLKRQDNKKINLYEIRTTTYIDHKIKLI